MTPELQAAAIEAVEKARADDAFAGSVKIKALKFLRDATGLSLPQCVPAVDWALARPRTPLTRAAKERAITEMAKRYGFSRIVANNVICDNSIPISHLPKWERALKRQMAALLRLAMARTID